MLLAAGTVVGLALVVNAMPAEHQAALLPLMRAPRARADNRPALLIRLPIRRAQRAPHRRQGDCWRANRSMTTSHKDSQGQKPARGSLRLVLSYDSEYPRLPGCQ